MVFAASQRAARNPAAPSFGCRGPIRLFSSNAGLSSQGLASAGLAMMGGNNATPHQSQFTSGNNAVSLGGITPCLPRRPRLAKVGQNKHRERMMPFRLPNLFALTAFAVAATV